MAEEPKRHVPHAQGLRAGSAWCLQLQVQGQGVEDDRDSKERVITLPVEGRNRKHPSWFAKGFSHGCRTRCGCHEDLF